jgi:ATP-dependent helicase HrpA
VPERLSESVNPEIFDWLVPGLILEKTIFLLKGLPKKIRKQIIPVQATAERILDSVEFGSGNYYKALSSALFKFFKVKVSRADWPVSLPGHLSMSFAICDENGKEIRTGDNYTDLVQRITNPTDLLDTHALDSLSRNLLNDLADRRFQSWDFSDIPARIPVYTQTNKIGGYLHAALQPTDDNQAVRIVFIDSVTQARATNRAGTCVLLQNYFRPQFKNLKKQISLALSGPSAVWLTASLGGTERVVGAILNLVMEDIFGVAFPQLISRDEFEVLLKTGREKNIGLRGREISDRVVQLLRYRKEVQDLLNKYRSQSPSNPVTAELYDDLDNRLHTILPPDFLECRRLDDFVNLERYLKSLAIRAERAYSNPAKDKQKRDKLVPHQKRLLGVEGQVNENDRECADAYGNYRFLLDEMQVSLFSPELKTATVVSEKKLQQAWQVLMQSC